MVRTSAESIWRRLGRYIHRVLAARACHRAVLAAAAEDKQPSPPPPANAPSPQPSGKEPSHA